MKTRKLKFYIDTSVWGFLFEETTLDKKQATEKFFNQVKEERFRVFVSALVIDEIERIEDKSLRENLRSAMKIHKPISLPYADTIDDIALSLVEMKAIPEDYIDDARHISYAVYYELDGIISWNMKHIVKLSTRRIVSALCKKEGLKEIDLLTPEEVIYV